MTREVAPKSTKTTKIFNRPHMIIPEEDTTWAIEQKPCVLRFWHQCWRIDPYGSRWMKLVTNLSDSAFRLARKILEAARLFVFRRVSYGSDGRTSFWEVRNLHGARVKNFWQGVKNEADTDSDKADTAPSETITASNKALILPQTQSEQTFQKPSGTSQEHLTNSFEEFVRCVSSTPAEISRVDETAIAPHEGASPSLIVGVEEKEEESPTAKMCTSLRRVDEQASQSTSLLGKNQDLGVEPTISQEDTCSAAQIEVVTNLSQCGHVRYPHERLAVDKWSQEAMNKRRELRPERQSKLYMANMLGDNPGFEFLSECWDDVALWTKIRQLVGKYPEWGVTCIDGKLFKT